MVIRIPSPLRRCTQALRARAGACPASEAGFTMVELLIVMTIILVLLAVAVPKYQQSVLAAREASLREDLQVMRQAIDSYTMDKQKAPQSLDDLVSAGYLRAVPIDPVTHSKDTWQPVTDDTLRTPDQSEPGVTDVHSGAQGDSSDGTQYSTW